MLLDIYKTEQVYYPDFESFCMQNCMLHILNYYGIENALFYINATLSLLVKEDSSRKFGYSLSYDYDSYTLLPEYKDKLKTMTHYKLTTDEVWELNKNKLKEGIPIITGVDTYYLNYIPEIYSKRYHANHEVILCGYTEDEKEVTVVDWYEPWFYKGSILQEEFLKARSSECPWDNLIYSGIPIRNYWGEIERDGWNSTREELIYDTIRISVNQYCCSELYTAGTFGGIGGVKKLLEIVMDNTGIDDKLRAEFLTDLHINIVRVVKRKKFFKCYIEMASKYHESEHMNTLKEILTTTIEKWDILSKTALKGSMMGTADADLKVTNRLKDILQYEEALSERLIAAKDSL